MGGGSLIVTSSDPSKSDPTRCSNAVVVVAVIVVTAASPVLPPVDSFLALRTPSFSERRSFFFFFLLASLGLIIRGSSVSVGMSDIVSSDDEWCGGQGRWLLYSDVDVGWFHRWRSERSGVMNEHDQHDDITCTSNRSHSTSDHTDAGNANVRRDQHLLLPTMSSLLQRRTLRVPILRAPTTNGRWRTTSDD